MRIKYLIALGILANLSYSNDFINNSKKLEYGINISSSYSNTNISETEFANAGLKKLVKDGGYKKGAVLASVDLEAKYPIISGDFKTSVGLGIGALFQSNIINNKYEVVENTSEETKRLESERNEASLEAKKSEAKYEEASLNYSEALAIYNAKMKPVRAKDQEIRIQQQEVNKIQKLQDSFVQNNYASVIAELNTKKEKVKTLETEITALAEFIAEKMEQFDAYANELEKRAEAGTATEEEIAELQKKSEELSSELEPKNEERQAKEAQRDQLNTEIEKEETAIAENPNGFLQSLNKEKELLATKKAERETLYNGISEYLEKKNNEEAKRNAARKERDAKEANVKEKETAYQESLKNKNNYENEKNSANLYNKLNKETVYGANAYALVELEKKIKDDFSAYASVKAGVIVTNNILYSVSSKLEQEQISIDGSTYVKPQGVSPLRVAPLVGIGLGVKYKGIKAGIIAGYNKGLIGAELGYEF